MHLFIQSQGLGRCNLFKWLCSSIPLKFPGWTERLMAAIRSVRALDDQAQWMISNWLIVIPPCLGQGSWFKLPWPCKLSVCGNPIHGSGSGEVRLPLCQAVRWGIIHAWWGHWDISEAEIIITPNETEGGKERINSNWCLQVLGYWFGWWL